MVPIDDGRACPVLALQFHDITEAALYVASSKMNCSAPVICNARFCPRHLRMFQGGLGAVSVPAEQVEEISTTSGSNRRTRL